MNPEVTAFFDEATFTVSYVVTDPQTRQCALIDTVLNYEAAAGRTATASADTMIEHVRSHDLEVMWIMETHVHADHLSAAPYLREQVGGDTVIGTDVIAVQKAFADIFNAGPAFLTDASQFDRTVADGETLELGSIGITAMHTPGHTPACMTYVAGDAAFVGDTLFMPDFGTARTDFPGGDAATLYRSIQKILSLPPQTRLFMCHDYKAPGRDVYAWESSVAEQREHNVHLCANATEEAFVQFRNDRDAQLKMPALILPSVQVNMRAGAFPPPEDNGQRYLKIPLDLV